MQGGILTSCQKDEDTSSKELLSEENNLDLSTQIKEFRNEMLSTQKSAGSMVFEEALYLMEASFNYYHTFVDEEYSSIETDTVYIPIDYNLNSVVNFSELSKLFKKVNNQLFELYDSFNKTNKKCKLYNFELESSANGNLLVLKQTIGEVSSSKSAADFSTPFNSYDYWYPALGDGKCDGSEIGEDHTTQLTWSTSTYYYYYDSKKSAKALGNNTYYVNVETYYPQSSSDLYAGYHDYCISPDEMNNYHTIVCQKIDYYHDYYNLSDDMVFAKNCAVIDDHFEGDDGYYFATWLWSVDYGIKVTRPIGEAPYNPSII